MHILDAFRDTPIRFTAINGIKVKKEKEESNHPLSVRGSELQKMCLFGNSLVKLYILGN